MSTSDLILVTGATGKIGSSIAKHLERLGKELRLLVRDLNKLSDFPEAEKVTGDYGDVDSLDRAFRGVSSAFIVSGYAEPGERAKLHRNAFRAAQRAGIRYLIYLSTLGASSDSCRDSPCRKAGPRTNHFLQQPSGHRWARCAPERSSAWR